MGVIDQLWHGNDAEILSLEHRILRVLSAFASQFDRLEEKLDRLQPAKPGPAVRGTITFRLEESVMAFTLPDNQTATGTLDLTDALGVHGATLDAPPTYSTSDPNVTATASADGMSVVIAVGAGAPSGDVQITAACVAGGNSFVIQGTVTIGAGPATGGSMNFALNS